LPALPTSDKLERKSETNNKENKPTKQSGKKVSDKKNENKANEGKIVNQKGSKVNGEKNKVIKEQDLEKAPQIKNGQLQENKSLRESLEEKSKKYSHLPVYDKEEEKRKAKERQAKMSAIFSDMDKQLESVTDLTSTHMAKKGITMNTSPTPFDDPKEESEPTSEIHTIRYNKGGVLNPRHSACQTQGISVEKDRPSIVSVSEKVSASEASEKPTFMDDKVETKKSDIKSETRIEVSKRASDGSGQGIQVTKGPKETTEPVYALPPYKRNPKLPVNKLSEQSEGATYESLGHTFRELTEKMQHVTKDIKSEPEIPFMDDGENEDYRQAVRQSTDQDSDTDTAISEALSGMLDLDQNVEKIQLEAGSSSSSSSTSMMVSERKCQGTDTIHMSKSTVRRDYTDV